jgi:hypothetical protein
LVYPGIDRIAGSADNNNLSAGRLSENNTNMDVICRNLQQYMLYPLPERQDK